MIYEYDECETLHKKEELEMFRKVLLLMSVTVVLVSGCSDSAKDDTNKSERTANSSVVSKADAYAAMDSKNIMAIPTSAEIEGDPSDISDIFARSTEVAVVTIESIDGGDNIMNSTREYIYPFTYGKLSVQAVYKGNLTEGSTIGYTRMGGIIPFDKYYDSQFQAQKEKLDRLMGDERPDYVEMKYDNDIQIEVGKSYMVYMVPYTEYDVEELPVYNIIGWEGGLREVQGNPKARTGLKLYNNYTKEWEALKTVIPE